MLRKKKNSPYWYAQMWQDGRTISLSTGCEKKRDAQAIHDEMRRKYRERRQKERIALLMSDCVSRPRKYLPVSRIWDKYKSLNSDWAQVGKVAFGLFQKHFNNDDADIADVDVDDCLAFLEQYKTASHKTYNTYKSALHKIWHIVMPFCSVSENPWGRIPNRSGESDYFRPFTKEEYEKILENTKGFWKDASIIAWNTGLRRKDIVTLRWDQIRDGRIELIPAKTMGTGKAVYIPIRSEVEEVLKSRRNGSQWIFPDDRKRSSYGHFNIEFRQILDGLEIKARVGEKIGFHSLRTSFITRMEEAGVPRHVLQGIVGHGSPMMTERYSHDKESAKAILKVK